MITNLDLSILEFIRQHFTCDFLDAAVPVITKLGDGGVFWIALTLLLLIPKKTRRVGLAMAISLVLDFMICNVLIKPLVARTRPYELRQVALLVPKPTDYSFPSGHTAASFASAGALLFMKTRGRWAALGLAILIGLSRLYLFVHFPTDVLGGVVVGLACGWAGSALAKQLSFRGGKGHS